MRYCIGVFLLHCIRYVCESPDAATSCKTVIIVQRKSLYFKNTMISPLVTSNKKNPRQAGRRGNTCKALQYYCLSGGFSAPAQPCVGLGFPLLALACKDVVLLNRAFPQDDAMLP